MSDFPPWLQFFLTLGGLWLVSTLLARHLQALALLLTGSAGIASAMYDLLVLPGVVMHELSHILVAFILRVRIVRVDLFRFRRRGDPRQGEVIVQRVDPLRMSLVGAAPLLAGVPVILYLLRWLALPALELSTVDVATLSALVRERPSLPGMYLLWAIATCMFPSAADRAAWWTVGAVLAFAGAILVLSGASASIPSRVPEMLMSILTRLTQGLLPVLLLNLALLAMVVILQWLVSRVSGKRVVTIR